MALQRRPALDLAADLAAITLVWLAALQAEGIVVGAAWGAEFSGAWEVTQVRRLVVPMAFAGLAPASLGVVGWWRVALLAGRRAVLARAALAGLGGVAGEALAVGVSHGRHFTNLGVRAAFVVALVLAGGAAGHGLVPRAARALRGRAGVMVLVGGAAGVLGWLADTRVLPRLYPTFHTAMLLVGLAGWGLAGLGVRATADVPRWIWTGLTALVALTVAGAAGWTPTAARRLESLHNLRIVLVEHAPMLGRAVELATTLRSPGAPAAGDGAAPSAAPGEVARSLDWSGSDLVLVSVDALRADHVSAYGYPRRTTPNLDALAAEGTLFTAAYCPTPHTSYSITSMMTGKYVRPLLALGLGEDSETWAQDLRLYGWRTAAFYPPAVFFIDEDRFARFERESLGFEYAKVEFAAPELRQSQVAGYLATAPKDKPLFLWVHFFEPHEPYVAHAEHVFTGGASRDVDAYDGEIATADDGIGRIVQVVRASRPGAVFIVTADHGEEFGEHGGRYHGTTVFEEQVRVPLVVAGPGVGKGARVASVVQTIDLLPTALSALGVPRPARLRGRDLGPLLSGKAREPDPGFALAETDDYALVASGDERLVCERRAAACVMYALTTDPGERRDASVERPARFTELRAELRDATRDHGRFEAGGGPVWPEALRRGMVGDVEAAPDVVSLLDDADLTIRRKAAEVAYALHVPATAPQLRRSFAEDEDDQVRRWVALALARVGEPAPALVEGTLLKDPSPAWRRRAALVLGERGNPRACETLDAWWSELAPAAGPGDPDGGPPQLPPQLPLDLPHARELLVATGRARCKGAVPALVVALQDVRARPYVADALGAIGDERARGPLLTRLAFEPYVTTRPHEAEALLSITKRQGLPPPPAAAGSGQVRLKRLAGAAQVVVVLLSDPGASLQVWADGEPLPEAPVDGPVRAMPVPVGHGASLDLKLQVSGGSVRAIWVAASAALD